MQLKPIDQQVVVLFGASTGIGRETALQFAQRGAKVVVAARNAQALEALAAAIRQRGGTAIAVPADTTDFEQVKAVAARAVQEYGRLDTWVHLAGVSIYAPFEETTPEEFKRIIDVNLMGQVYGAMAALPHLRREGRGALIHISSVAARRSLPLQSAYSASKHGVEGFLDSLRVELQYENVPISVTNIMPASINTPLFSSARTKLGAKPAPLPPVYDPRIVTEAILYAAEHPIRDMAVGGAAKAIIATQAIAPALLDMVFADMGYRFQKTNEPKAVNAPDNLYEPMRQEMRIAGDYPEKWPPTLTSWQKKPAPQPAQQIMITTGIALVAGFISQVLKSTR